MILCPPERFRVLAPYPYITINRILTSGSTARALFQPFTCILCTVRAFYTEYDTITHVSNTCVLPVQRHNRLPGEPHLSERLGVGDIDADSLLGRRIGREGGEEVRPAGVRVHGQVQVGDVVHGIRCCAD